MATTGKTTPKTKPKAKPRASRRDPLADASRADGQGGHDAAREGFTAALPIRRQIGDRKGEADCLYQIARIDLIHGPAPSEPREQTIRELAAEYLQHPDEWLDHPHPLFDGKTPNEMIAEGREDMVRNLFFCYANGLS